MKILAVCQEELVARTLHRALSPNFEIEFLVQDRALARHLHDAGLVAGIADPRRVDSYLKADVTPTTCVIIEDNGKRSLRRVLEAVSAAGATLVYTLVVRDRPASKRADDWRAEFPDVTALNLGDLVRNSLLISLGRSLTRARVQQYQRYFENADRVLILLHNDPDPDAMASGLALRNLLHRTKTTAIIGAFQGVTRPENLRMAHLLDIQVKSVTADTLDRFDRIATVDVQPSYFGGLLNQVSLVVDHHPEQPGYSTVFKDIRPDYGSTSTIFTEHLRAVEANISERTATAMLYAIKSDTLFLSRHTHREDLDAFTFLYPLAHATLVRKMEGAEITLERLKFVARAVQAGQVRDQIFITHLGVSPREDLAPYVADFLLQLEDVAWSIVSAQVNDWLVISVRNLGYSRNAGEFVRTLFSDIGSAGGHRTMAKAVVPVAAFRKKFGSAGDGQITELLGDLAVKVLREQTSVERPRDTAPGNEAGVRRGANTRAAQHSSPTREARDVK